MPIESDLHVMEILKSSDEELTRVTNMLREMTEKTTNKG